MYSLNKLKTLVSCGRDPARSLPLRRGFLLIPLMLVCFAFSQNAQAAPSPESPDPPGAVPGLFNTRDGDRAGASFTGAAVANSAFGAFSSFVLAGGSFNTSVGAGALDLNLADLNTAVGAASLLLNVTGTRNTAVGVAAMETASVGNDNTAAGAFALFSNVNGDNNNAFGSDALRSLQGFLSDTSPGDFNNAFGRAALASNTNGFGNNAFGDEALFADLLGALNTAVGDLALTSNLGDKSGAGNFNTAVGGEALFANTTGASNNAVGADALVDNATGSFNTAIGDSVGAGNTSGDGNIYIGAFSVPVPDGESFTIRIGDDPSGSLFPSACFIGGIFGASVPGGTPVIVDASGHLGTVPAGSPLSMSELLKQRQIVQELKATTEKQAARIALQEGQIKELTAALKQQADQIQKVSAQLEMIRPAPRVVENR
jgi:hypothetical protein